MHANGESNTNEQIKKVCEYTSFKKKAPTNMTKPLKTQAVNTK